MKLEGKISILINREYTTIEVEDKNSNVQFLEIKLTPEQLSAALSRTALIDCEIKVDNLEKVGKIHECKYFEFEISETKARNSFSKELQLIAQSKLTDGWIADSYFGSQTSFFKKNGVQMARCIIRRWI